MGLATNYSTVVDQLFAQNITSSRAFSLNLAGINKTQGSIIFGGIDTMKYSGTLEKVAIIPPRLSPDGFPRYWMQLDSISITPPNRTSATKITPTNVTQHIFPDSGSTLSVLSSSIFSTLLSYFPEAVGHGGGAYTIPCSYRSLNGTISFTFGQTTIDVSYYEWIWFDNIQCWFGAVSSSGEKQVLGDSFMRSAYVVYDQDNYNIHVAQAANCGSNVIPITNGVGAVPSATGDCSMSVLKSTVIAVSTISSSSTVSSSLPIAPPHHQRPHSLES
ncbi:aspartic peptidase domain-containing protein [Tricladium varicosporioides]|nr:aspartic peptidase domain-containing protein [Hymenoscyphus varicosporioides]